MVSDRRSPASTMHATVGVETLQSLPLPGTHWFDKQFRHDERYELECGIFCKVYSAMLDDVEAFDPPLESKFSKEIVGIVRTYASAFAIDDERFNQRLGRLNGQAHEPDAVEGLSGATILDYLVSLVAEKSKPGALKTLDDYQNRLASLNLTKAMRDVSNMETTPGDYFGPKNIGRAIGLPKTLFICIGPHTGSRDKHTNDTADALEKNKVETNKNKKNDREKAQQNLHVVGSSPEAFSNRERQLWADRMQLERMRSVSIRNFRLVCATERRFFTTSAAGSKSRESGDDQDSEFVRRYNFIDDWLATNYCASVSASGTVIPSTAEPDPRIGIYNHCGETAGVFDVCAGFQSRSRCYKCASVYLYHMDLASVRAECDLDGPQWSEIVYNWLFTGSIDQEDDANAEDEGLLMGSPCAEPLCHLLCSQLM